MARKPRIDYPGAVHHVMNRGADHQIVFRNDGDRQLFLTIWARAVSKFGIVVLSFALIDNHFHIVLVSPEAQLSRTLQFVGKEYTQRFNNVHGRDGALFRGRFHSVLVDSNVYLFRVVRYVELNPVGAGLTDLAALGEYRWSSFGSYIGQRPTPAWLEAGRILNAFGARKQFDQFVRSDWSDAELELFYRGSISPGRVLGGEDFVERISQQIESPVALTAGIPRTSLEEIDAVVTVLCACTPDQLRASAPGRRNAARSIAVGLAHMLTDMTSSELADRYGFASRQAVHGAVRASHSSKAPMYDMMTACLRSLGRDSEGNLLRN